MSEPAVNLALLLLSVMGLTHLARPDVWRVVIVEWANQGPAGVAKYATMHALPGAVLIALVLPIEGAADVIVLLLGALLLVKGTLMILFPECRAEYLLRMTSRSLTARRLSASIDLVLIAAIVFTSAGLM